MCSLPSVTNDMSDEDRDAISVGRVQGGKGRPRPSVDADDRGFNGTERGIKRQTRNPGCRAVTFGPRAVRARRARTAPRRPRSHWLRAPYARLPTGVAGPPRHALRP